MFQAGNEGVINVLGMKCHRNYSVLTYPSFTENYFEMSHIDAEEALKLYRRFCKQTEYVVEFLGVARKMQNLLSVPVPNLKHVRQALLPSFCS